MPAPSYTCDQVIDDAQALCNDTSGVTYTDARMLILLKIAHRQLQKALTSRGLQTMQRVTAAQTITAGTATFTAPSDLIMPIKMEERGVGEGADAWTLMERAYTEPVRLGQSTLGTWVFRDATFYFTAATQNREIRLWYYGTLLPVPATGAGGAQLFLNTQDFLTYKLAALAALTIGENENRAAIFEEQARAEVEDLIGQFVKDQQSLPVTRRPRRRRF